MLSIRKDLDVIIHKNVTLASLMGIFGISVGGIAGLVGGGDIYAYAVPAIVDLFAPNLLSQLR